MKTLYNNPATSVWRKNICITYLCTLILAGVATACRDDNFVSGFYDEVFDGEEISMQASLSVDPIVSGDAESRADEFIMATPEEKIITDFWVIEYNEKGVRVGLPRYYTVDEEKASSPQDVLTQDLKIIVPREDEQEYTCVIIANTHNDNLFNANNRPEFSTLEALRSFDVDVHNQEDLFDPNPEDQHEKRYLLMSGWTKISKNTQQLHIDLIRNVCKINITLSDFADASLIFKYFQWVDVPLGKVFPHGTRVQYSEPVNRDWRMHNEVDLFNALQSEDGLTFWLPCNVWLPDDPQSGVASNAKESDMQVEEEPTHFDLVCRKKVGVGDDNDAILPEDLYEFRIYPSKNAKEQFKFEPNHYYHIDVSIDELPSVENEYFMRSVAEVEPISNTYMYTRDTKGVKIIPIQRINMYWDVYDKSMKLGKDDEWVAEVIWQDTDQRIIDFALYSLGEIPEDRSKYFGVGNSYFVLRTTGTGVGNVVIGVRRKFDGEAPDSKEGIPPIEERQYLWSWHLWVTDYNPNVVNYDVVDPEDDPIQIVPDGIVYGFNTKQWIMDRNVGAEIGDFTNWDDFRRTFGLSYQFGRKDPFPYPDVDVQAVYDIYGDKIEAFNSNNVMTDRGPKTLNMLTMDASTESINESIKYPYKFVVGDPTSTGDYTTMWELDNDIMSNPDNQERTWLSPDWYLDYLFSLEEDQGCEYDRSLFDPCPPDWILVYSYTDLDLNFWDKWNVYAIPLYYPDTDAMSCGGMLISINDCRIIMPIAYSRDYKHSRLEEGFYWCAQGYAITVNRGGVYETGPNYLNGFAYGSAGQVRCMRRPPWTF